MCIYKKCINIVNIYKIKIILMSWIKVFVVVKLKIGVKFYYSCINCKCFICEGIVVLWYVSLSFL